MQYGSKNTAQNITSGTGDGRGFGFGTNITTTSSNVFDSKTRSGILKKYRTKNSTWSDNMDLDGNGGGDGVGMGLGSPSVRDVEILDIKLPPSKILKMIEPLEIKIDSYHA
jgi:hypothetical protein